jgi:predicted ATP-grasp superfamily ATP-dependent carboligase
MPTSGEEDCSYCCSCCPPPLLLILLLLPFQFLLLNASLQERNVKSAARSSQRVRDRIVDLEIKVDEWKAKVENIMEQIKKLEAESGMDSCVEASM